MADFIPHSHFPYGKEGCGLYTEMSISVLKYMALLKDMILECTDLIEVENDSPFVIVDYGTADGGTSMDVFRDVIAEIRKKYGAMQEVNVIYEDQPVNDFKSLFARIYDQIPGCKSYLKEFKNVYVSVTGTNFYQQCVPKNSVHLGVSSTALHWLYQRPCNLRDCTNYLLSSNQVEKDAFSQQAAKDWETVLLERAKELKPGGYFTVGCLGDDGKTDIKIPYKNMNYHWSQMLKEGKITEEEFENTTFNFYFRTPEEFSTPFKGSKSKIFHAGLRLVKLQTNIVTSPCYKNWISEENLPDNGDTAEEYAKLLVHGVRIWSNSVFKSALSDSRTEKEKDRIVDELYERYGKEIAKSPENHYRNNVIVCMMITRIKE